MKRIGVITIPDYENYGNRLQNYAVVKIFENQGFKVETLELNDIEFSKYNERKNKLLLKKYKLNLFVTAYNRIKKGKRYAKHYKLFETFSQKNLNIKYYPKYNKKTIDKLNKTYDFFILGSDQIWNPNINDTPNIYFATFASKEKKFPFAASFGVKNIIEAKRELYRKNLNSFQYITVRENAGKRIVNELSETKCDVLCDPTLLLSVESWKKLAKKPKRILAQQQEFVFSFFLGPKSEKYKQYINDNFNSDQIINIDELRDNLEFETCGPKEFLWYIQNAKFILTDSFHATVFSILFNKDFLVFSRLDQNLKHAGMDSRIEQLLKIAGLECRMFDNGMDKKESLINFNQELIKYKKIFMSLVNDYLNK